MTNPLLNDRDVSFLLYDVFDAASLLALPHFADHSKETFDAYVGLCARFARETVFPAFKAVDEEPPRLVDGQVHAHPRLRDILPKMREVGVFAASRPFEVGGQQLPLTVADGGAPLPHGREPGRLQLRGPHDGRGAPHRGVRERRR